MIRDVTDLEVYKESLTLLEKLYAFLRKVPKTEYDSIIQCKRAGKSIPANISEGFAKRQSGAEFKRYLQNLKNEAEELSEGYKILSKRINSLHKIWH